MAVPPSSHASQLRLLWWAAWRQGTRRLAGGAGAGRAAIFAFLGLLTALGIGLVVIPAEVVRGDDANPGGTVLEMAFWLTALACAVLSFRVMEALFRTGDARILAPLPVRTPVLFVYRLLGAGAEALLTLVIAALVFAPVAWRGGGDLYLACMWVWSSGMALTVAVGLAVVLYAGVAHYRGDGQFGAFGPMGFALAPGIALAISVTLILVEKLVAEELLRAGFADLNRGARVGAGVAAGAIILSLGLAWSWFRAAFHGAFARFLEADLLVLDSGYAYFAEGPLVPRGWERFLPADLVPLVRKDRLQFRRRHALARLGVLGVAVGLMVLLVGRGADALPMALLVALPMLVVVVFANPWGRLAGHELEPGLGDTLPVTPARVLRARTLVATREALELLGPLSLAVAIGIGAGHRGWTYGAAVGALAFAVAATASPLLMRLARSRPSQALALGVGLGLLVLTVASFAVLAVLPLTLVFGGLALFLARPAAPAPGLRP